MFATYPVRHGVLSSSLACCCHLRYKVMAFERQINLIDSDHQLLRRHFSLQISLPRFLNIAH